MLSLIKNLIWVICLCICIFSSYNGALCPLRVWAENETKDCIWTNPRPGGDEFLRPYLMSYEAESEDMVYYTLTCSYNFNVISGDQEQ